MFESRDKLKEEIGRVLEGLRAATGARHAAILDPTGVLFESAEPPDDDHAVRLRHFLERRRHDLFAIPAAMGTDASMDDAFDEWGEDEFVLVFVNGRVALVLACAGAGAARDRLARGLNVLVDRLVRWEPRYRMDARGRGFFFGRAKLDVVLVGGAAAEG